jgi:transposase-like protein
MPWRECSVTEERLRFLARLLEGEGMSEVCREFEIQGRIGEQLKAQYDDAAPVPDRLAELLEQLARLELLKEITQLMDEPDSKGG